MSNKKLDTSLIEFFKRRFPADVRIKIDNAENKEIVGNEYTVLSVNDNGHLLCKDDMDADIELNPADCTFYKLNQHELVSVDSEGNEVTMTNVKEVSEFIISQGCLSNSYIYEKISGLFVLNTIGIFIDRIADMEYRTELLAVLIPMQRNYPSYLFSKSEADSEENFCDNSEEVIEQEAEAIGDMSM